MIGKAVMNNIAAAAAGHRREKITAGARPAKNGAAISNPRLPEMTSPSASKALSTIVIAPIAKTKNHDAGLVAPTLSAVASAGGASSRNILRVGRSAIV